MATSRAVILVALLVAIPAHAVFHIAVIDELMSGVNGNPAIQYVEIRTLLSGQNQVCHSRLTVFKCQADGGGSQVLIDDLGGPTATNTPPCLPNGGTGVRWIMASPSAAAFLAASGIAADFTWDDAATGSIPTSCGMVCWGAPGSGIVPPPEPPTFDATNPFNYVDCVAYGPYDGTAQPLGNAPATGTPGNGTLSLTKTDTTAFSNSLQLASPTPENNAGAMGTFGSAPATTTTTLASGGSTTTTTLPPASGKSRCSARQLLAAAKKIGAEARCQSKAAARGNVGKLAGCLAKADASFAGAYARASAAGNCRTTATAAAVESIVDGFVDGLRVRLVGGSSAASRCAAKELAAAGKKASAELRCHAKAVAKGSNAKLAGCLAAADASFAKAYARAIAGGNCLQAVGAATVEADVDAFVADVRAAVAP